jgi:hypothetical protein
MKFMRFRGRNLFLSAVLFLTLGLFLLMAGCVASTGETPDESQAVSTTSTPDGICLPLAETPCGPEESSADQEAAPNPVPTGGTVRAVLFWMEGCPHCETVLNKVLPPLEAKYGNTLEVRRVEVEGLQAVDQLYLLGKRLGIPKEDVGVPLLLLGDRALIGLDLIQNQLPALIQAELARAAWIFRRCPNLIFFQPARRRSPPNSRSPRPTGWRSTSSGATAARTAQRPNLSCSPLIKIRSRWNCTRLKSICSGKPGAVLRNGRSFWLQPRSVPTIFIGDQYWEGYSDQIKNEIQAAVDACLLLGCPDAGPGMIPEVDNGTNDAT